MTPAEKILKMIEAVDPEDSDTLDEIDARFWCYLTEGGIEWNDRHISANFPKYTTSLDAAMSIGEEELQGWQFGIGHSVPIDGFQCRLTEKMGPGAERIESPWQTRDSAGKLNCRQGLSMPRAICHARLQALEYVRKNHD